MCSHNTLACTCADLHKLELACAETDLCKHASCHANLYLPDLNHHKLVVVSAMFNAACALVRCHCLAIALTS